jgi:hypothetical protein
MPPRALLAGDGAGGEREQIQEAVGRRTGPRRPQLGPMGRDSALRSAGQSRAGVADPQHPVAAHAS